MFKILMGAAALSLAAGTSLAQTGALAPETRTVSTAVAPPGMVVSPAGANSFVVTPVPGVLASTQVRIQNFSDYDLNRDGAYAPMEFAQALYFLATTDPVAGDPKLPMMDRYMHRSAPQKMAPSDAVALLNATADQFATADMNNDWRVTQDELARLPIM